MNRPFVSIVVGMILVLNDASHLPATEKLPETATLQLATFQADVTPPKGDAVGIGFMRNVLSIEHPLLAKGIVLQSDKTRYVLCAIDYCGLCNQSYDLFREKIAAAAKTTIDKVALHSLHQHTAPVLDAPARRILYQDEPELLAHGLAYADRAAEQIAAAVKMAKGKMQRVTHTGSGKGKVKRVASNRRVPQKDGSIVVRSSSATEQKLQQAPEGLIDPWLRTVAFYQDDKPLAYLHYYATHPQSFYGDGRITYDVPGLARERLQKNTGVFQVYFTGCGGDVAMGKYNNGTRQARSQLAERLYQGMRRSVMAIKKQPVGRFTWDTRTLRFPLRKNKNFTSEAAQKILDNDKASFASKIKAAELLAYNRLVKAGRTAELSCLSLGDIRILHLPGETFVEYQLFAQQLKPKLFVACAAYGECAMWYIGPDRIYTDRGGYEQTWSFGGPVEKPYKQLISDILSTHH